MTRLRPYSSREEILDSFESGKLKSIPNVANEISRHRKYARNTLLKIKESTFGSLKEI